ncbi:hypothetical protein LUR56_39705 [Streptomyces sp. MT29]|nr:hypothetical protein [Streptomyces sp. MT29]
MTARLTRWAGLCAAVPLALVLTGCGGGGDDLKPVFPTLKAPSPAPAASADPDAAEKAAVLKAYEGLTEAEARSYATAKLDPELETYAGHKALADIKATIFYHQQQNTRMQGTVAREPKVDTIDTASDPLEATITDCADSSQYEEIEAKSGKVRKLKSPGPRRHYVTSTAQRARTGEWKIYTYTIERDRTC